MNHRTEFSTLHLARQWSPAPSLIPAALRGKCASCSRRDANVGSCAYVPAATGPGTAGVSPGSSLYLRSRRLRSFIALGFAARAGRTLGYHSMRKRSDAPLWISMGTRRNGKAHFERTGELRSLSGSRIPDILMKLGERARAKKRLNAHAFRHACTGSSKQTHPTWPRVARFSRDIGTVPLEEHPARGTMLGRCRDTCLQLLPAPTVTRERAGAWRRLGAPSTWH